MANRVDPNPIGAVCSGSTLFASILNSSVMLGNYLQQTTSADDIFRCIFLGALRVNSLPTGYLCMLFCRLLIFFKITFFKKLFQQYHQSVKQFGSRSGPTFCRTWTGTKLFAKIISRRHYSTVVGKELMQQNAPYCTSWSQYKYRPSTTFMNITWSHTVILLPAHPASFAHKFLFQRVPASPGMQ